jgi:CRP-like cAMP-binding protein
MADITLFRNSSDYIEYAPGQVIFYEGDAGDHMYAVIEGTVDIVKGGKVIDSAGPDTIFGEMALIDQSPRSASAIAQTACKIVPVDQNRFTFMVQQTPFFSLQVMRVMADRLRHRMSEHNA